MDDLKGVATRDGHHLLVPITGTNLHAVIDAEGADDLFRAAPLPWWYNDNGYGQAYVKHRQKGVRGGLGIVARKIAGAGIGQVVRHSNRDRLDLRRDNLVVGGGRAKGQTPDIDTLGEIAA